MSDQTPRRPRRHRAVKAATIAMFAAVPIVAAGGFDGAAAPPATSEPTDETQPTLLPLAPDRERVDLESPTFSNPTIIDNPLFPISNLHSGVLLGNTEGHPIKIETTLLPDPVIIEVDGQPIEALASQFLAYEDGRIHEVAIDWYAQDDEGNVWYLGEDVFNYEDGVVADTHGTWMAGRDGPVAMIMPANPQGGEVFRPENIPGVLLEEVTIQEVGVTMDGPLGPVEGGIIAQENHTIEGIYENKWFAPGYGEFFSGIGDSLEGIALAVPTDAVSEPVPSELMTLSDGAVVIVDAAFAEDWDTVASTQTSMLEAWDAYTASRDVPPRLADQLNRALDALAGDGLVPAADDHNVEGTANAALDVGQASVDLQLQFRPPTEIDRERFELWARQLEIDANRTEANLAFVAGDVATLEWVLQRFAHTLGADAVAEIEALLADLRMAADDEDVEAAADIASRLVELLTDLEPA